MTSFHSNFALIKRLNTLIEHHVNQAIRDTGLTMSQGALMFRLMSAPEGILTLKQAEQIMKLSQPVTAGIVKRLEEKGYVESFGSEKDKRIKLIRATALGREHLLEAQKIMTGLEQEIFCVLSPDEIQYLEASLLKINDTMEDKWRDQHETD